MRFTKLYEELKFDDVFPVASKEEIATRKAHYQELTFKEILDKLKKTKLPDGTWHVHEGLNLSDIALSSLIGLNVSIVDGRFKVSVNQLTSLEGSPKEVKGMFSCAYNHLTSLEHSPIKVGERFLCCNNKLTSLEGAPKEVGGDFDCSENVKAFTEEEVRAVCDVKGKIEV